MLKVMGYELVCQLCEGQIGEDIGQRLVKFLGSYCDSLDLRKDEILIYGDGRRNERRYKRSKKLLKV